MGAGNQKRQQAERKQFEAQIAVLCAGYNIPVTNERNEAYWRGLIKMPLGTLERVVDHALGPEGPEKIPNPRQMWGIYRDLRSAGASSSRPGGPPIKIDPYVQFANVRLLEFLTHGNHRLGTPASEDSLVELVLIKNKLVADFHEIAARDPRHETQPYAVFADNQQDFREMLMEAFAQRWQPMPQEEVQRADECFARTGRLPGFSVDALARLNQRLL
jgi:hypothetical protein